MQISDFRFFEPLPARAQPTSQLATGDSLDRVYERLLVLRCQTGDEAAFAEIVARYQSRLRLYLRQMLAGAADSHAGDDVLQDVWFDVFRSIGRLNDAGAFTAWLYRIARDRAWRVLRRKGVRPASIEEVDVVDRADDSSNFDVEQVNASLDRLPLEQREVLLLRFVEQMSYEQIASAVGCELGTVRSRLHYAKRALRELIERERKRT